MNSFTFASPEAAPPDPKIRHEHPAAPTPPPKRVRHLGAERNEEVYVNNVEIRIPSKNANEDINVRDNIAIYFAAMKQVDTTIAILPLSNSDLPAILHSTSLPSNSECINKYFTTPTVDRRFTRVHLYIQTTQRFNNIKYHPFVKAKLNKSGVWLLPHNIKSHNVTSVGWIFGHIPDQYSCFNVMQKINSILPQELHNKYQLNVKTIPHFLSKKTHTRA